MVKQEPITTPSAEPAKRKRKWLSPRGRKVANALGFLVWSCVLVKTFVFDLDNYLLSRFLPSYAGILQYKGLAFLGVAVIGAVLARFQRPKEALLRVVFFPFVAIGWLIPSYLIRNWALLVAFAPTIQTVVRHRRSFFIWSCIAILSGATILLANSKPALIVSSGVLALFLVRHYLLEFKKTFQPSSVFADLAGLVRGSRAAIVKAALPSSSISDVDGKEISAAEVSKRKLALQTAYFVQSCLLICAEKLRDVAKSRKLDIYFIASLAFTFALTIVCFAFYHFAAYKVDPSNYKPDVPLTFLDFLGFSFCMMTRAPLTAVGVASNAATALGYIQAIVFFVFAAIVVNFLLASARDRHKEDLDTVIEELRTGATEIENQMSSNFHLTYEDLENILVQESLDLVNSLRTVRGLPKVAVPAVIPAVTSPGTSTIASIAAPQSKPTEETSGVPI